LRAMKIGGCASDNADRSLEANSQVSESIEFR
jgi:hypothetical protein